MIGAHDQRYPVAIRSTSLPYVHQEEPLLLLLLPRLTNAKHRGCSKSECDYSQPFGHLHELWPPRPSSSLTWNGRILLERSL